MKLKFANVLLIATLFASAAGSFSSCKDTDQDLYNKLEDQYMALGQKMQADIDALKARLDVIEQDYVTHPELKAELDKIYDLLGDNVQGNYPTVAARFNAIEKLLYQYGDSVEKFSAAITDIQKTLIDLKDADEMMNGRISDLDAKLDSAIGAINDSIINLNTKLEDYNTLTNERIDSLAEEVEKLAADVYNRLDNIDNRVSSIVVQKVTSPVIGCLQLPLDVQSMILFNYYGSAVGQVTFPNFAPIDGNNYGYQAQKGDEGLISNASQALLAAAPITVAGSYVNSDFGKVYFSVNPTTVSLDNKTFTLINSKGEEAPIHLSAPVESDEEIAFGYSRGDFEANKEVYLYEANATITTDDINDAKYDFEPGLKSAVKDALKQHNASSFATLAKLVYKQVSGDALPAYALKASWTELDTAGNVQPMSVVSQFNMAATTVRPLSYATLYGQDLSDKLPALPSLEKLQDKVNAFIDEVSGKLRFEFNTNHIAGVNVPALTVSISVDTKNITYEFPVYEQQADGSWKFIKNEVRQVNGISGPDGLIQDMVNELNKSYNGYSKDIQACINDLVDQVKDVLIQAENDINDQMSDVVAMIQNKSDRAFDKISRFYDLVEKVYNRVQRFFTNPNHYLQVMMAYTGSTSGRLSTTKAIPTVFSGTGTAVTLVPTTYTAELLSPAYKKYVAVSNVWAANGASATDGDAKCVELLKAANGAINMNQVISGDVKTVAFDFAGARGGNYTYEIFYQALDYRGNTSTQKFYVTIK